MARIIPNANSWIGFKTTVTGGALTTGPTAASDIAGATVLTSFVTSINASLSGNAVPVPAFDTLFEYNVVGTTQATFSADFYRDDGTAGGTDAAWTTLPINTTGYFLICRYGISAGSLPIVGKKIEVWPVTVIARTMSNMASNSVETFTVTCVCPTQPNDSLTVQ